MEYFYNAVGNWKVLFLCKTASTSLGISIDSKTVSETLKEKYLVY